MITDKQAHALYAHCKEHFGNTLTECRQPQSRPLLSCTGCMLSDCKLKQPGSFCSDRRRTSNIRVINDSASCGHAIVICSVNLPYSI